MRAVPASRAALLNEALRVCRAELLAYVRARVVDADADDVLQLALMRAAEHAGDLEDPERVRAWLFRIVRNTLVDARRADRSRERLVTSDVDPPDLEAPSADASCRCSAQQTQTLPRSYSTILTLVDLGGASLTEAAAVLEITVNNATVRLHRARKALRERLREHCGVSSAAACKSCRCVYDGCCDT